MDQKICLRCGLSLPLEDFGKNMARKDGKHYYCKTCTHKIGSTRSQVGRKPSGNHDIRPSSLEWAQTILKQEGKCAICSEPDHQLVNDHNHERLEFRGALCTSCNLRLGKLEREKDWVILAMQYLNWFNNIL